MAAANFNTEGIETRPERDDLRPGGEIRESRQTEPLLWIAERESVLPRAALDFYDLGDRFRLRYRYVLKRVRTSLLMFLLCTFFLSIIAAGWTPADAASDSTRAQLLQLVVPMFLIVSAVFLLRLAYEFLYRAVYRYAIAEGNLSITRGVIFRESGSFPLSRINDIYIDYDLLDLLLFLRSVRIATPSAESSAFGRIPGLSPADAEALKHELEQMSRAIRCLEAQGSASAASWGRSQGPV